MYARMMAVCERTVEEGGGSRICPPWRANSRLFILLVGKFETVSENGLEFAHHSQTAPVFGIDPKTKTIRTLLASRNPTLQQTIPKQRRPNMQYMRTERPG